MPRYQHYWCWNNPILLTGNALFAINTYCKCTNLIAVKSYLAHFVQLLDHEFKSPLKGTWFNKYSRNASVLILTSPNCCFALECSPFVRMSNKWSTMATANSPEFSTKEPILKYKKNVCYFKQKKSTFPSNFFSRLKTNISSSWISPHNS